MVKRLPSKQGSRVRFSSPAPMKDNKYWFVRKPYGYGWVPATWHGWAVLGVYTGALFSIFAQPMDPDMTGRQFFLTFILPALGSTGVLVAVSWIKGEKPPRWQWGGEEIKKKSSRD